MKNLTRLMTMQREELIIFFVTLPSGWSLRHKTESRMNSENTYTVIQLKAFYLLSRKLMFELLQITVLRFIRV